MRPLYKRSVLAGPDTVLEQSGPSNFTGLSVTPVVEQKNVSDPVNTGTTDKYPRCRIHRKWCLYADVEPTRGHLALC
jgi:hypothetical protein